MRILPVSPIMSPQLGRGSSSCVTLWQKIGITIVVLTFLVHTVLTVPVNVALNKPVTALYTCGQFGKEYFNTLSDIYSSHSNRPRRSCIDIRSNGGSVSETTQSTQIKPSYPPEAMVDGNIDTHWQSVSRSKTYHYGQELMLDMSRELEARIDIDLLQEFIAEQITIQLGDALTPQKIAIHKSMDGKTFIPWVYAVASLDQCEQFFSTTIKSQPASRTDNICVAYVADDKPPGDTISLDLSQTDVTLKEWQRVRYLKINFFDMLYAYPYNVLANTFNHYAVSELTVLAECPCNGLQEGCEISPTSGMYECICGGNTRGRFCESCLPLFNQFPFRYGQPCVECNCFEHATSCFYQASVEAEKLSLDKNGTRTGGGVCASCQHNTAGINCEKCVDLYYRPPDRVQTAVDACIPCQCNASGSGVNPATGLVDCLMSSDEPSTDGKVPGDCYCKTHVIGSKCHECKEGFYNLQQNNPDGCTPCACHTPGTAGASELCTKDMSGQCSCKNNVESRTCDTCKDGFYGLADDNVNGCSPCDCDVGGAVNQVCDKLTGQCVCRSENIVGRQCNTVRANYYHPGPHGIYTELEDSFGEILWRRDKQYSGYSGQGYAVVENGDSLTTLITVPSVAVLSEEFIFILTYRSFVDSSVDIQPHSAGVNFSVSLNLPACPDRWCQVNTSITDLVSLYSGPNLISLTITSGLAFLDKLVAFPMDFFNTESLLPYSLPGDCDLLKNTQPSDPNDIATCEGAIFSLTMFHLGAPLPCNCDPTGSFSAACQVNGGDCECQPGVVGRTCDACSPEHYGFSSTGCTECNCDEYGSTCDAVTGQCNCPENTIGRQCEFCAPNTWGWNQTLGCKPCDCDQFGSLSQQCNDTTGICTCRIGVEGAKCDQCQDGYYNLDSQSCAPCLCNAAGSSNTVCNKTSGQCDCKSNTAGRQCNTCHPGTFGLDSKNPEGCLDCICMGITTECASAGIKLSSNLYRLSKKLENGSVPTLNMATTDGTFFNASVYFDSNADMTSAVVVDLTENEPRLFWMMPDSLVANLLSLYGSSISFTVNYVIVDGQSLPDNKAVLVSSTGVVLEYPLDTVSQGVDSAHTVTLREMGWQDTGTGAAPSRGKFITALATSTALLIPASYSAGKHTSRLSKLEFSSVSDVGPVNPAVEQCTCGVEYNGRSCEMCQAGYRRENVSSSDYLGVCVPCMCNEHTSLCDPDTGNCQNCMDNTTGDMCEECLPGFYGDATQGTSTDCSLCPCYPPRVVNATCRMDDNSTSIVCAFCEDGYIGDLCDECDALYYGDPKVANGTCLPCTCNGNSDICDTSTGICESCGFNTTGQSCESCIVGFYGNASLQTCQECSCLNSTSNSSACDTVNGQCDCVYGVEGRTCDYCLMGFWGFNTPDFVGCQPCGCVEAGSTNIQCNNDTGVCSCKPNTVGDKCDVCEYGYYGLPMTPCQACDCDPTGSVNTTCNKTSGECECKPGVGGRNCDQCLPFHVNFNDTGCDECSKCHTTLGDSVTTQLTVADEILGRTLIVLGVQEEDKRLQMLVARLNESTDLLGLAGSSATSVTDIISNVTSLQMMLTTSFQTTENEVSRLLSAAEEDEDKGSLEVARHANMTATATNLTTDFTKLEDSLSTYILYLTQYNASASQYLNRGGIASNTSLTFQSELARASSLLSEAGLTPEMEAANDAVTRQASEVVTLNSTLASLNGDFDSAAQSVTNLSSVSDGLYFTSASVDSTLTQATVFRFQVADLTDAVNSILDSIESKNSESATMLSAARAAAQNTDTIYNGNAQTVMTGEDFLPFPNDVTNFLTGTSRLQSLLASIPVLTGQVEAAVNQSEAHMQSLEVSFISLRSSYNNISSVGRDAAEAIQNFETVVKDLDTTVSTITTANQLIEEVRGNVSGEAFGRLSQEYTTEKANAEDMRTAFMSLDYQPQVLQSSIDAANARLDNENVQWAQADAELASMRSAAQTLNTQIKDNALSSQLASATETLQESLTTAQTTAASAVSQNAVLDQRQGELGLVQGQVTQAQDLQQNVTQRLTEHQAAYEVFQASLASANTLSQGSVEKTRSISDKIELLESKLANAEALLAQLRKPVKFDGTLGLELPNSQAAVEHLYDDIMLDMRKPGNFTDGVVFYTDHPGTNAELEIGLLNDQVFFEYSAGTQVLRVTSPAEICDNCWARVYASRYADIGQLSVTLLLTGGVASDGTRGSGDPNARFLTLNSNLFIGTLPEAKQTASVDNREFRGCLHNVKYQGQLLSLWTTSATSSQAAKCCQAPPDLPTAPIIPGASFSGFGYLVLSPESLIFSQTRQMSLEFRTYLADVVLFSVVSADQSTRNIMYLSNGTFVWEINTGGLLYTLRSQNQYATGQWVQVFAQGEGTGFTLQVKYVGDTGDPDTTTITVQFIDLTPLDGQNVVLGSVGDPLPAGYNAGDTNFAGCMRRFTITTTASSIPLTFTENVVAEEGVSTDGCFENVIEGLRFNTGSSYAQLSAVEQIQQLRTIDIDFVTEQPHGVLLYINAPGSLRFLYLAVFSGNVILIYRQDNTVAVVSSGQYVSDGQLHTVKIDSLTLRVAMRVDGLAFEEQSQVLSVNYLSFSPNASLRLGGLEEVSVQPDFPVASSIIGGISRLTINDRLVTFTQSTIVGQQDVTLAGIQSPSATTPAPPVSTVAPLLECAKPTVPTLLPLSGGFTMDGTSSINWSELSTDVTLPEYFERNFALTLDFAAYKADGVLLYVADLLNSPTYYLSLYLLGGYFHLRMKTNLDVEYDVQLQKVYNDGQRHQMKVIKINDFVSVDVDAEKDYVNTKANSSVASQLPIPPSTTVFLGGIGISDLPTAALPTELKETPKVNFAGAIYTIDLRSDELAESRVLFPFDQLDRTEYPAVPVNVYYGVSLPGNNSYLGLGAVTTPQNIFVELTFITVSESGLFFLIDRATSAKYMAMDMSEQQLRLHLYPSYNGVTEPMMITLYESANLCDGQQHTVQLQIQSNVATATVDNKVGPTFFIPTSHAVQAFIDAELYIGGYAGGNGALPSVLNTSGLTGCVISVQLSTGLTGNTITIFDPTEFVSTSSGISYSCPM